MAPEIEMQPIHLKCLDIPDNGQRKLSLDVLRLLVEKYIQETLGVKDWTGSIEFHAHLGKVPKATVKQTVQF